MNMIYLRKIKLIVICCTTICITAQAQIDRNTWTVGGSFDLGIELGRTAGSIDRFQVQPKVGYFPIKHLQAGAVVLVDYEKTEFREAVLQTGFGPFVRYYIKTPKNISPYVSTELLFTSHTTFALGENTNFRRPQETLIRPGVGFAIFLTPRIALENQVNFEYATTDKIKFGEWSTLQFSVGFQLHFYRKEDTKKVGVSVAN